MRPIPSNTAILLFSRSAAAEAVAKPLTNQAYPSDRAVAGHLIRHTHRMARRSGLPVFLISENQQHGHNFGERLADAFEQVFAKGFERVISIGNDCPALTSEDLLAAAKGLDTASFLFGPASDGGVYLIGMHGKAYNRAAFLDIHWQTALVFEELKHCADGDFCCLDEKSDVDTPLVLMRALHQGTLPIRLKIRLLICLRRILPVVFSPPRRFPAAAFRHCRALRGPPRRCAWSMEFISL